jgi:hypothetical protein
MLRKSRSKPRPPTYHRDRFDYAQGIIIGLTFLAAVAAAFFTARQAYLGNKQLKTARDALALSEENGMRQLRAYVGISDHRIENVATTAPKFSCANGA